MLTIIKEKKLNETKNDPIKWVEVHGDYLYRYAVSRMHDESAAEDLVQETLLAALKSRNGFMSEASERTWLTAILKHKIIDHYRKNCRMVLADPEEDQTVEDYFDECGSWKDGNAPKQWGKTPESLYEQKELSTVMSKCLAQLPENLRTVFTLREIEGLSTEEICTILNLKPNNLWVLLHRARLHLRQSIETTWLRQKENIKSFSGRLAFSV